MKSTYSIKKIGSGLMAVAFLLLIGAATSTQAQYRRDDRNRDDQYYEQQRRDRDEYQRRRRNRRGGQYNDGYSDLGGSFQLRQTALNAGANEGNKEGRKDRSRGERFDFTDESAFQKATKDYSSRLGDREIYRRYFREAFEHGYRDGYAGY
jgi:hypothetical protein